MNGLSSPPPLISLITIYYLALSLCLPILDNMYPMPYQDFESIRALLDTIPEAVKANCLEIIDDEGDGLTLFIAKDRTTAIRALDIKPGAMVAPLKLLWSDRQPSLRTLLQLPAAVTPSREPAPNEHGTEAAAPTPTGDLTNPHKDATDQATHPHDRIQDRVPHEAIATMDVQVAPAPGDRPSSMEDPDPLRSPEAKRGSPRAGSHPPTVSDDGGVEDDDLTGLDMAEPSLMAVQATARPHYIYTQGGGTTRRKDLARRRSLGLVPPPRPRMKSRRPREPMEPPTPRVRKHGRTDSEASVGSAKRRRLHPTVVDTDDADDESHESTREINACEVEGGSTSTANSSASQTQMSESGHSQVGEGGRSQAISRKGKGSGKGGKGQRDREEEALDWLVNKMPGDKVSGKEMRRREKMVRQALSIGNVESVKGWQDIYQRWRLDNTVMSVGGRAAAGDALAAAVGPSVNRVVNRFQEAYRACERSEVGGLIQRIQNRVTLAELADAYEGAYAAIRPKGAAAADEEEEEEIGRGSSGGLKDATRRKRILFFAIYPDWRRTCGDDPTQYPAMKKRFDKLNKMHFYGTRWRQLREGLGLGVLGLFPPTVPSSFVERDLRAEEVTLWISLIKEFNPECIRLGEVILKGLQLALQGGGPIEKILPLERATESDIKARDKSHQLCSLFDEDTDGGGWLSSGAGHSPVLPSWPSPGGLETIVDRTLFESFNDFNLDQFLLQYPDAEKNLDATEQA